LITDTKSTVFDTVNFPVKVISGLWTDSVCARRRPIPPGSEYYPKGLYCQ